MPKVAIIGAGVGGMTAAIRLAGQGFDVTILERSAEPGGRIDCATPGSAPIDAGPTRFTMRWVLDEVFDEAGANLDDHLKLTRLDILARHAWSGGATLDLHSDAARTEDAIRRFAGSTEARGFRDLSERARRAYETMEGPFLRAPRAGAIEEHARAAPFLSLGRLLTEHFRDPRLRQVFARYATDNGAAPHEAPASLILLAHAERQGAWVIEGGMQRLARALADLAVRRGAAIRYGAEATEILAERGRATGVVLANGECLAADAVIANADAGALQAGRFGLAAQRAVPAAKGKASLSAVIWCVEAEATGFPLLRHSVFFPHDERTEFEQIFAGRQLPRAPSVHLHAQDRDGKGRAPAVLERFQLLTHAPAIGDERALTSQEIRQCEKAVFGLLETCGLQMKRHAEAVITPRDFAERFPGTGGALFGRAPHGWKASLARPGVRTALPGLYLAGGSVHPGPGIPMAAMSGRLAAARLASDLASSTPRPRMAMRGGIWTRSARTAETV